MKKMNFIEKLASYKLWHMLSSDLPDIAMQWIMEWYNSESLYILAGLGQSDNMSELIEFFNKTLSELKIVLPTMRESFNLFLKFYLINIKNWNIDFDTWVNIIYSKLLIPFCNLFWDDNKIIYESCGLSILWSFFIHYIDLNEDVEAGYLYNKDTNVEELKENYKKDIYDEIDICLNKLHKWILN